MTNSVKIVDRFVLDWVCGGCCAVRPYTQRQRWRCNEIIDEAQKGEGVATQSLHGSLEMKRTGHAPNPVGLLEAPPARELVNI